MESLVFLAKVNLEAELEFEWTALPHNTVHVLCQKHLDGHWFLAALDDTALGIACPDALGHAVPFVLGEHTTSRPPAVLPEHIAYARDHFKTLAKYQLVAIEQSTMWEGGWVGSGFFYPAERPEVQHYVARMRAGGVPLLPRGALFHWVMLRMSGHEQGEIDDFSLEDVWKGFCKMSPQEISDLETSVHNLCDATPPSDAKTIETLKGWLRLGNIDGGFQVDSRMLRMALTPQRRAWLWLFLHPKAAKEDVEFFCMQGWTQHRAIYKAETEQCLKQWHDDPEKFKRRNDKRIARLYAHFEAKDNLNEMHIAEALVAAVYICRKIAAIEAGRKRGVVHTLAGYEDRKHAMFAKGVYSGMQEAEKIEDYSNIEEFKFRTMPQVVAAAFTDSCLA